MNLLVDTHFLLWAATSPRRLPREAARLMSSPGNKLISSVVSLWEIAIKRSLNRPDFTTDVATFRAGLLANGYGELPVEGRHVLALPALRYFHADPFDRLLVAQAKADGLHLLTADRHVARYGDPVLYVGS